MISCPNCHEAMIDQAAEAFSGTEPLQIGSCATCNLLWFDRSGSIRLTPRAVLGLFKYIGEVAGTEVGQQPAAAAPSSRATLAATFRCPLCADALSFTHDLQRNTRFTYWRCSNDLGQLFTFNQFLREKNFIRSPSPAELARLRATVRQISCSQCGGPIDLVKDTACAHCGASIALIDPEGVAKAVRDLTSGNASASPATQEQTSVTFSNAQLDAMFAMQRLKEPDRSTDLVGIGVAAIGALVGAILNAQ